MLCKSYLNKDAKKIIIIKEKNMAVISVDSIRNRFPFPKTEFRT